jgi:long-chain acyl-CoA synthetase
MHKDGGELVERPSEDLNTVLDAFRKTVKRIPNHEYLGTRNPDLEGRPYEWMTWQEVHDLSENMSRGCVELGLVPESHGDGRTFKFMGIYGINRWEWYVTNFANMMNSCTTVSFYDTLGPEAIEFVMEQTGLATISVQLKSVEGLIKLKEAGKSHNV